MLHALVLYMKLKAGIYGTGNRLVIFVNALNTIRGQFIQECTLAYEQGESLQNSIQNVN